MRSKAAVEGKDGVLVACTGKDSRHWVKRIQKLIQQTCFDPAPGVVHPDCDPVAWLTPLSAEVAEAIAKSRRGSYDENITAAGVMAIILATWSVRISRAKAHDPNRPVRGRRTALKTVRTLAAAIADATFDETQDGKYFDQPWEYPMAKTATNGSFK